MNDHDHDPPMHDPDADPQAALAPVDRPEDALPLSADQTAAWEAIAARLARHGVDLDAERARPRPRSGQAEVLAITGKAGSGKTVLLARAARALAACGLAQVTADWEPSKRRPRRSFAVLAPTNKAVSVLRNRGVTGATTIHRCVNIPVYDPKFEILLAWLQGEKATKPDAAALKPGLTPEALDRAKAAFARHGSEPAALAAVGLRGADFIIDWEWREDPLDIALVDEASMIDAQQMMRLSEIFPLSILFGDPAQLAPIQPAAAKGKAGKRAGKRETGAPTRGPDGGKTDWGKMVFDALPETGLRDLRRVHRQAADNPILDLAHALGDPGLDYYAFDAEIHKAAAEEEATGRGRVRVAERADAALMTDSPVLVWTNRTRIRLIHAFRSAHRIAPDAMVAGEPLICDGLELPRKLHKSRIALEARGLIKGAQARYLGPGRKEEYARIDLRDTDESGISVAAIIQIESPDEAEPRLIAAARMGALFLHGAAVTIHKAQGSQWPTVQVYAPDIRAAAHSNRTEAGTPLWKRLAYVAVTRAEERLIWVTRNAVSRPPVPLGDGDGDGDGASAPDPPA